MRDNPHQPEQYLTVANVARQLGVSAWTVRDWLKDGKLAAYKVGRSRKAPVRIKTSDLDAMLIPYVPSGSRTNRHSNEAEPAGERQAPLPGRRRPAPPDSPPPGHDRITD